MMPPQRRVIACAVFSGGIIVCYWSALGTLIQLALKQEHYSHVLAVPLISGALFILDRKDIFAQMSTSWRAGLILLGLGAGLHGASRRYEAALSQNDALALVILSLLLVWVAGFAFCFGARALRRGIFPSALLLLMIPLPDLLLRELIRSLQMGTADVSEALFRLTGVAFLRSGMDFELPGFIVEIAEECSGIRSSMALLITNLIAGHLFLRSTWSKLALTLVTAPLLIVKNAIRIVTLSLLSVHVDPGFLTGNLHRSGGAVFFLIALILLGAALISLQKVERTYGGRLHA